MIRYNKKVLLTTILFDVAQIISLGSQWMKEHLCSLQSNMLLGKDSHKVHFIYNENVRRVFIISSISVDLCEARYWLSSLFLKF